MDIGLHLPSAQPGAHAAGILQVARAAEEVGFDSVWMFDHLFTPVGLESPYPYSRDGSYALTDSDPFFDPLALFGVLAGATDKVKIATGVLVAAYRHPIVLAKTLASIENFAPGRIVLGMGAGWMREEFDAVGVPYDKRGAVLEEYIGALRALWSGESTDFEGTFFSWPKAGFLPAPTSPIPIILGGHSDRAVERAARVADGWAVVTGKGQGRGLEGAATRIGFVTRALESNGRDPATFTLAFQHALWFTDEPSTSMPFVGPPDHIAASIKSLADLGVSMIDLIVIGPAEVMVENARRFSEEVRPLL